jgi:general secretion pathway protein M
MNPSSSNNALQALRQEWQTRWTAMAPRERQLATAAFWLALLTVLVMVGVRPALKTLRETPAQLQEVDAQLDDMKRLAEESQALRQRPPVPPAQAQAALKSATDRLGPAGRLTVQGDRATLTLTKVPGDALASWLEDARSAARVKPVEAGLMQVEPGVYSGHIVVTLGPGAGGDR